MDSSHLTEKEIILKCEEMINYRHYCKCGHPVYIANKNGRAICQHCHNYVFKDKETEFKYRMNEKLMKEKRNLENEV